MRKLTISIPTVNRVSYLQTLGSVLSNCTRIPGFETLETIYVDRQPDIVNCCSAKHMYSVFEHYGVKTRLVKQTQKGIGNARALQLQNCETELLCNIDDDVIITNDTLSQIYEPFNIPCNKDSRVTAVMPLMLSNYDPNNQLGSTFMNMKIRHIDGVDLETDSDTHVLFPFMNQVCDDGWIQEYDILYAICCMLDMTKFKREPAIETLYKWNPKKGYEDRWLGKYLLSQDCKIFVMVNTFCYHFMEPSEHRHWASDIDCNEELNLLRNLLNNPFVV